MVLVRHLLFRYSNERCVCYIIQINNYLFKWNTYLLDYYCVEQLVSGIPYFQVNLTIRYYRKTLTQFTEWHYLFKSCDHRHRHILVSIDFSLFETSFHLNLECVQQKHLENMATMHMQPSCRFVANIIYRSNFRWVKDNSNNESYLQFTENTCLFSRKFWWKN